MSEFLEKIYLDNFFSAITKTSLVFRGKRLILTTLTYLLLILGSTSELNTK